LSTFSQVAFPVLSRARTMSGAQLRETVLRSLTLVTLFGLSAGIGLAVTSTDLVPLLFGPGWQDSVAPMALLGLAAGIGSVGYGVGDAYLAIGRPRIRFWILGAITVPTIIGFVLAAPHGITAVAGVHLATAVLFSLIQFAVANRLLGISPVAALGALRGAAGAAAGLLVATLPILAGIDPGSGRLVLLIVAGSAGAAVGGTALDRRLPRLLRDLLASLEIRARRPATA
jgi:PST family polysaccharide transporter